MPHLSVKAASRQIEEFAALSLGNRRLRTTEPDFPYSYEQRLGLDLQAVTQELRQRFPNEMLLALDVGGAKGEFALQLQRIGYRAFCLDPAPGGKVRGLAHGSMIVCPIEGCRIPDKTFHFITSIATLSPKTLLLSVGEIHRLLRPGGRAFLDLSFCTERGLSSLDSISSLSMEPIPGARSVRLLRY